MTQQSTSNWSSKGGRWLVTIRLRAEVNNQRQKWPMTRALTVTQQLSMTKVGVRGGQQCNNQPTTGKQWLVTRPPEGSGRRLAAKTAGNKICSATRRHMTTNLENER